MEFNEDVVFDCQFELYDEDDDYLVCALFSCEALHFEAKRI